MNAIKVERAAISYVLILVFQPSLSLSTRLSLSTTIIHLTTPSLPPPFFSLLYTHHNTTQEGKRETKTKTKGGRCMSHNTTQLTLSHIPHSPPSIPLNSHNSTSSLAFCLRFLTTSLLSCHLIPPFSLFLFFFIFIFTGIFPNNNGFFCLPFSLFFFFVSCVMSFWRFFTSFFPPWCVMRFLVMGILSWLRKSLKTWSFSCWLFWVSLNFLLNVLFGLCLCVVKWVCLRLYGPLPKGGRLMGLTSP